MESLEISREKAAVAWLDDQPYVVEVRKDGKGGWPDRQVFLGDNRHFWIEFKKRKGGRMTPAQRRVLPRLIASGETVLINPSLEEIQKTYMQILKEITNASIRRR